MREESVIRCLDSVDDLLELQDQLARLLRNGYLRLSRERYAHPISVIGQTCAAADGRNRDSSWHVRLDTNGFVSDVQRNTNHLSIMTLRSENVREASKFFVEALGIAGQIAAVQSKIDSSLDDEDGSRRLLHL